MLKIKNIKEIKGKFIIASPIMIDERFIDSIIFICEITFNGAYGLMINNFQNKVSTELKNTIFESTKIFSGGPIAHEKLFMLHSNDHEWKQTLKISQEVYLTNVNDALKNTKILPKQYMIIEGYTKWNEEQLEKEIILGQWLAYENNKDFLFDHKHERKWSKALKELEIDENKYASHIGIS